MKRGTIVLVPFLFTDLSTTKRRPAVIISKYNPLKEDVVVAFISSNIRPKLEDTDLFINISDKDFKKTGLHKSSVIKADKLLTIGKKIISGELGFLSERLLSELNEKIKLALELG